jgi:hypothetical protein
MAYIGDKKILLSPQFHISEGYAEGYAAGQQKGIKQGKLAILNESKYMHPTISGSAISVNDVNSMEHSLGVELTSDTITDLSGVEVSRYGKNLCSNIFSEYANTNYCSFYIGNVPLIMSLKDKDTSVDISGCYFGWAVDPNNVNNGYRWVVENGTVKSLKTNTSVQNGKRCPYLIIYPGGDNAETTLNKIMQRWDIQVELGTVATEFEPYKSYLTATASADGTVEGLTSLSPNMTLVSDTEGVTINCEYYRDIDTYINNLTTNIALTGGN